MTYSDYIRGSEVMLGVAPTGYRYSTAENESLPVSPESVAKHVYESMSLGASIAHLHGRDSSGNPDAKRLPLFGSAVRELCDSDILLEYAVGPDVPTGEYLDVLDSDPRPELASVRLGPTQYGYRSTTERSRRDTEQLINELTDRGIKPNLLVTGGSDLHEVRRLRERSVLTDPPVLTLLLGAPKGAVGTPMSLYSLLDAIPDRASCFVRATGPNQYPLTSMAFFFGAHPMVGMEDNLFFAPDQPVTRNAQLVRSVTQLTQNSLRDIADVDAVREELSFSASLSEREMSQYNDASR